MNKPSGGYELNLFNVSTGALMWRKRCKTKEAPKVSDSAINLSTARWPTEVCVCVSCVFMCITVYDSLLPPLTAAN